MVSRSTSSGTRARIASVACCSHSPASGPSGGRLRDVLERHARLEAPVHRAHRRHLGIGEDDARHRLEVRLAALAQDVGGDDLALVLPDVGQLPDAFDVTDRPEAVRRTQARIDGDALRVGADADRLQAQLPHAGPPAGGDEEAVTSQLATVVELEDVVGALAPGGGGMHAEVQLDAFLAQDVAELRPSPILRGRASEERGSVHGQGLEEIRRDWRLGIRAVRRWQIRQ
jgi:hypothetical protein